MEIADALSQVDQINKYVDQVNKYVVFHKFPYNYNIVGRLAMIFLNEFKFK